MRYKLFVVLTLASLTAALIFAVRNTNLIPHTSSSPVLADIGSYRLSVDDYMYMTRTMSSGQLKALEAPAGKRRMLKRLIDEEIMLQEAQRLGLDKDPDFMKTIETYWKQTLIILLIKRKNQEILSGINIYQRDREEFYKTMLYTYDLRIFEFETAKDAELFRTIYPDANDNYSDISELKNDSGWQTYNYEDIDIDFRPAVKNSPMQCVAKTPDDRFFFIAAKRGVNRKLSSMEEMQETLNNLIREEKFRQARKEWQEQLETTTDVKINDNNLKELNPLKQSQSPREK